ncbi:MAG: SRPBCC family protein [Verrucomicrobiota bacterium]
MTYLRQEQLLPISHEEAWSFFSTPRNLEQLTPPSMPFRIECLRSEDIHEGQLISYRIRLFPLVWTTWVTEIKEVVPGESFVDDQAVGPYALWRHIHRLEPVSAQETNVIDEIYYHVGMGFLGSLAAALYVDRQVQSIFAYRKSVLEQRWNP